MSRIAIAAAVAALSLAGCVSTPDLRGNLQLPDPVATPAVIAPPTPQPTILTAKERLVRAIENNGCMMTTENVGAILTDATISQAEFRTLGAELVAEGRAEAAGEGALRIVSSNCA